MTTTKSNALTAETIAKYEAAGFKRWTKGSMDRLYIDATKLGLEVATFKSGNARSDGTWCGFDVYKVEANEILHSKVWIDIATGELHVVTDFNPSFGEPTVEDVARKYIEGITAEEEEEEEETIETESEGEDMDEDSIITIEAESILYGNYVNAPKRSGKPVDAPTGERVTVELDGQTYERTVYERVIWKNMGESETAARFVIINNVNYLV